MLAKFIRHSLIAILYSTVVLFGAQAAWGHSTPNSGPGVENFGRVTDTLYRGAQPSLEGLKSLKDMGVGVIVNFRDESREIASEQREAESLGLKYISIPWSGSDEPSNAQIVQFLDLVQANPQTKIFVHCKRGADRTGTMIAAYRVAVEHEAAREAVSEMSRFHYAHFFLPQLERYVNSLPQLLQQNPVFKTYGSQPAAPLAPASVSSGAVTAAASAIGAF